MLVFIASLIVGQLASKYSPHPLIMGAVMLAVVASGLMFAFSSVKNVKP